jgi:hypothetical protein
MWEAENTHCDSRSMSASFSCNRKEELSMAFIQATRLDYNKPIHINVSQIISVSQPGNQTVITVAAQGQNGPAGYPVKETVEDIMNQIQAATP